MIRTAFVFVGVAILTVVYGSWLLLLARLGAKRTECSCERLAKRWSRAILRMSGVRVHVEGAERIPEGAPVILAANHQSWFDVFAMIAHFPGRIRFVAKRELENVPVFGPSWKACGHISIDREDRGSAIGSLGEASRQVREGSKIIVMFAEGTRSPDGRLQPFKKGAFVLAIQSGVPVLPVALIGPHDVMPKGAWRIRPGKIQIKVGTPVPVEGLRHRDRNRLRDEVWREVAILKGDGEEELVGALHGRNDPIEKGTPGEEEA